MLRLRQSNRGRHKLTPPWEGPYIVAQVLKPGTYKLANEKGEILTNAWNIEHHVVSTLKLPSIVYIVSRNILKRIPLIVLNF